jgi:hypothetical protein
MITPVEQSILDAAGRILERERVIDPPAEKSTPAKPRSVAEAQAEYSKKYS